VWRSHGSALSCSSGTLVPFSQGEARMPAKRTTHRSTGGKKLYAVRDAEGKFEDIQTYKRAHSQDIKRKAKAEKSSKKKG
jgi:hypothetical protein